MVTQQTMNMAIKVIIITIKIGEKVEIILNTNPNNTNSKVAMPIMIIMSLEGAQFTHRIGMKP